MHVVHAVKTYFLCCATHTSKASADPRGRLFISFTAFVMQIIIDVVFTVTA